MSKQFRDLLNQEYTLITSNDMRTYCQRPGKRGNDGKIQYMTEQSHRDQCDVNKIIRKYDKTGLINHVSRIEAQYGDTTGIDYKSALDKVLNAKKLFSELPSKIRNRFKNNVSEMLTFMEDGNNREEAIKLGMIQSTWTPETDGLGEHVKEDGHKTALKTEQE